MSSERARVGVDFFADLSCPWCYVGWNALKRAASERRERIAASVAWRSFLLSPDLPPEGIDRKSYLETKIGPERLRAASEALNAHASALDLPIALDAATRIPSTIDAHRLVHWASAERCGEAMIDALFHAYFVDGADIGEASLLAEIANGVGMDPNAVAARLSTAEDRDVILGFHNAARKLGLSGVPVALFNRAVAVQGAESAERYGQALDQTAA